MMNAGELIGLMQHAVGKPDGSLAIGHDMWQTLNRAGRTLTYMRQWNWRRTGPISFKLDAARSTPLPADFGSLIGAQIDNTQASAYTSIVMSTAQEIDRLYDVSLNSIEAGSLHLAFPTYDRQADRQSEPVGKLLVYPEVTSTDTVIKLQYFNLWRELTKDDTLAVPDIPTQWEDALIYLARSKAYSIEYQMDSGDAALAKAELVSLATEDAKRQRKYGFMRGGARTRRRLGRNVGQATL